MTKVFISYKTSPANSPTAGLLETFLQSLGYEVFLDKSGLHGGHRWEDTIFQEIFGSDVLILLVTGDVVIANTDVGPLASPWVQREVDYAKGCGVQILPVVIYNDDLQKDPASKKDKASMVLENLAMTGTQYVRALDTINRREERFGPLVAEINRLAAETRTRQAELQSGLTTKWREQDRLDPLKNPPVPGVPHFASFLVVNPRTLVPYACQIHLAAGNITAMSTAKQPIDVLVNSENVYMQMQRVVDRDSVSKTIRLGGRKGWGNYIQEDTIQQELFSQVFPPKGNGVPVQIGDVFITSAGHDQSDLRRKGIKQVFHVAAVDADPQGGQKQIGNKGQIILCIKNCLDALHSLNENNKANSLPVFTSIIFPLLGTGQGGLDVRSAGEAIIDTVKEYILDTSGTALEHVYIAAYTMSNVHDVKQIMDLKLQPMPAP